MKNSFILLLTLVATASFGQVGIGTTTPSNASMLEISSSVSGTSLYRGLMPPRIPTTSDLVSIPANINDVGLLVYVIDIGSLQIWNGISWEEIYSLTTTPAVIARQDFDSNLSWTYTNTPNFYFDYPNDDVWGIISTFTETVPDANIDNVDNNFLAIRDIDNPIAGTNVDHTISFVNVDISAFNNVRIAFDYDIFEFDNGDDVDYVVYYDDIAQAPVSLLNGASNSSSEGTVTIIIPPGINDVKIDLIINQNGNDDYAGFDNFIVFAQ